MSAGADAGCVRAMRSLWVGTLVATVVHVSFDVWHALCPLLEVVCTADMGGEGRVGWCPARPPAPPGTSLEP